MDSNLTALLGELPMLPDDPSDEDRPLPPLPAGRKPQGAFQRRLPSSLPPIPTDPEMMTQERKVKTNGMSNGSETDSSLVLQLPFSKPKINGHDHGASPRTPPPLPPRTPSPRQPPIAKPGPQSSSQDLPSSAALQKLNDEVQDLRAQNTQLQSRVNVLEADRARVQDQHASLEAASHEAELKAAAQIEELHSTLQHLNNTLADKEHDLAAAEQQLTTTTRELEALKEVSDLQLKTQDEESAQSASALASLQAQIAALEGALQNERCTNERLREDVMQAEIDRQRQGEQHTKEIEIIVEEKTELLVKQAKSADDLTSLQGKLQETEHKAQEAESEADGLRRQIAELQAQLQNQREAQVTESQLVQAQTQLKAALEEVSANRTSFTEQLVEKEAEITQLRSQLAQSNAELASSQAECDSTGTALEELTVHLAKVEADLKRSQDQLRKKAPSNKGQADARSYQLEQQLSSTQQELQRVKIRLETGESQAMELSGLCTELQASNKQLKEERDALDSQVRHLQGLEELLQDRNDLIERLSEEIQQHKSASTDTEALHREVDVLRDQLAVEAEKLAEQQALHEEVQRKHAADIQTSNQQLTDFGAKYTELEEKYNTDISAKDVHLQEAQAALSQAESMRAQSEKRCKEMIQELETLRRSHESTPDIASELHEAEAAKARAEQAQAQAEASKADLEAEASSLRDQLHALRASQKAQAESSAAENKEDVEKLYGRIADLTAELVGMEEQLQRERKDWAVTSGELTQKNSDLRNEVISLRAELTALQTTGTTLKEGHKRGHSGSLRQIAALNAELKSDVERKLEESLALERSGLGPESTSDDSDEGSGSDSSSSHKPGSSVGATPDLKPIQEHPPSEMTLKDKILAAETQLPPSKTARGTLTRSRSRTIGSGSQTERTRRFSRSTSLVDVRPVSKQEHEALRKRIRQLTLEKQTQKAELESRVKFAEKNRSKQVRELQAEVKVLQRTIKELKLKVKRANMGSSTPKRGKSPVKQRTPVTRTRTPGVREESIAVTSFEELQQRALQMKQSKSPSRKRASRAHGRQPVQDDHAAKYALRSDEIKLKQAEQRSKEADKKRKAAERSRKNAEKAAALREQRKKQMALARSRSLSAIRPDGEDGPRRRRTNTLDSMPPSIEQLVAAFKAAHHELLGSVPFTHIDHSRFQFGTRTIRISYVHNKLWVRDKGAQKLIDRFVKDNVREEHRLLRAEAKRKSSSAKRRAPRAGDSASSTPKTLSPVRPTRTRNRASTTGHSTPGHERVPTQTLSPSPSSPQPANTQAAPRERPRSHTRTGTLRRTARPGSSTKLSSVLHTTPQPIRRSASRQSKSEPQTDPSTADPVTTSGANDETKQPSSPDSPPTPDAFLPARTTPAPNPAAQPVFDDGEARPRTESAPAPTVPEDMSVRPGRSHTSPSESKKPEEVVVTERHMSELEAMIAAVRSRNTSRTSLSGSGPQ